MNLRHPVSLVVATAIVAAPSTAAADDGDRSRVYDLSPEIDLPLLALGLATTSAAFIEVAPPACLPTCEVPDGMNAIDRTVLGSHSPTSHAIADGLVLTLALGPPVWSAFDAGTAEGWFADSVVHGESILLTQGLTQIVKFAVQRPAPLVYDERVPWRSARGATPRAASGPATPRPRSPPRPPTR
jgi:hypothetical protein